MTAPLFSAAMVSNFMLQADNSLKETDGLEIHFCLQGGKVHYEVRKCESELEEVVSEVEDTYGGFTQSRYFRHKVEAQPEPERKESKTKKEPKK